MARKKPPHLTELVLEQTLIDQYFALADSDPDPFIVTPNPAFDFLIASLGSIPGGPYDFAYVTKQASTPGKIVVGDSLESLSGIVSTGNGKDNIDLGSSLGNNFVRSGNANDSVKGGGGNDLVFGQNGNDVLAGGAGNDNLDGGNGKDTLTGGTDAGTFSNAPDPLTSVMTLSFSVGDILAGGSGKDTFIYTLGDGVDELTDFRPRQDTLRLVGIDQDDLISTTDGTNLYIGFDDGAGGWTANSVIRIDGVTNLNTLIDDGSLLFA